MIEKNENHNLTFNRIITVGFILALLFLGIGVIYLAKVLEKRIESGKSGTTQVNPLIVKPEEPVDDDIPDIPGVFVYDVDKDVDKLKADTQSREKQFRKNIEEENRDPDSSSQKEFLKKKNEFASKMLEFLKKIESAKTKEERDKLKKELKEFSERK